MAERPGSWLLSSMAARNAGRAAQRNWNGAFVGIVTSADSHGTHAGRRMIRSVRRAVLNEQSSSFHNTSVLFSVPDLQAEKGFCLRGG